ncbi:TPA: hypothetical protein HGS55_24950 [Escherichia coli]|nr:hypothetical protein [Salmonella enterica]HAG8097600.1 hypothetical protein [Escherichia coli]
MWLKFTGCDRGSFSGGLLPFLPVCCRDRAERVSAVRTMRRYGKWSGFSGRSDTNNSNTVQIMIFLKYR